MSSTGAASLRSGSCVLLENAQKGNDSFCELGAYLWVWHGAQPMEGAIQTAMVVVTRSTTAALRNSSSLVPPSLLVMVFRWKAVAVSVSSSASGRRSPAICSMVNLSKGLFELNERMT